MKANIFRHEFRTRLGSAIGWGVAMVALAFLFFSIYPVYADQAELLKTMMDKFPPELLAAFGMDNLDMTSVLGFYSLMFLFVQLCLAIQAANYGVGLVSIEETELTADFLITKPVSRLEIINSKLLAALAALTLTNLSFWVASFLAIPAFSEGRPYDQGTLILLLLSIVIFQLSFLSIGMLISLLVKRVRNVTPYALGLGFGAYTINGLGGVLGEVKLEMITPFKHLDAAAIAQTGAYDTPLVLLNVAITLVALTASYWLYLRRDIPTAS